MNEHIRELAKQSGATTFGGKPCFFGEEDIEKFAQAIAEECAILCIESRHTMDGYGIPANGTLFHDEIKKRFGLNKSFVDMHPGSFPERQWK